jgi:hypothetical protein
MRTYAFRIKCKLAAGDLGIPAREFLLTLPALTSPITVQLPERRRPLEDQFLILWCGGFTSEEETRAAGVRVKTAVMLAGVLLGFGIDVGTDQVISPGAQRKDGQPDDHLQPDVHGLQVVPEIDGKMLFGFVYVGDLVPKNFPQSFQEKVAESYVQNKVLTKKQTLAAQLYNQSHFLSSDAARFVTLISAVEALSEQRNRSPVARALIAQMIQMTAAASGLEEDERKSLKDALGNLKRASIRSTCRALVKMYGEPSDVKHFRHAYEIRSTLVHEGEPPPGIDLAAELRTLDPLVRRLIVRHVAVSS